MPLTRITGIQVKDQSITEDDLSLSDKLDWNVSIQRHGFCPKLPNNPSLFLNGQGQWAALPGAALPQNVYYVSPSFIQNSGQYWSNLKLLEQEINGLPSGREPLIVIYPGVYSWTGELEFNRFVSIMAQGATLGGTLKIKQGAEVYVKQLTKCLIDGCTPDVTVFAYYIGEIETENANEGYYQVFANTIDIINANGIAMRFNIYANKIYQCNIGEAFYNIWGAKITNGLVTGEDANVSFYDCVVEAESFLSGKARFHNCTINFGVNVIDGRVAFYDCFINANTAEGIICTQDSYLLLSDTNIVCDGSWSISGQGYLYVRGQSTANTARDPNMVLMTPIDLIVDHNYENERYFY
ncbi:MAG TPA: hypothetical protein PLU67_02635 [Candidatus Kapabacteria bacterium]|nr:hypothetical protein [Candidatus Kapabacteria bacterium]